MKHEKVLVPYNFTNYDQKALDFVIRTFANSPDAEITLFAAHTPVPRLDVGASPVMDRLKGSLNYLENQKREQETALKQAANILIEGGFGEEQVHPLFVPRKKDVAADIIELVQKDDYGIVVLNHKRGKATNFFTGSVYSKVVNALKDTTICVVT